MADLLVAFTFTVPDFVLGLIVGALVTAAVFIGWGMHLYDRDKTGGTS